MPVLSMDYMFMNEKTDDYNFPILVLHDSESEGVWAIFVKRKGNYSEYVSKRHLPYRNWCPICVKAKRKNPSHRKTDAGQHKHVPVLSMDYMFMNERTDEHNFPILVLHDSGSEGFGPFSSRGKETTVSMYPRGLQRS